MTEPAGSTPVPDFAHAIRNHLSGIINALELARLISSDNPVLTGALDLADRQADALRRLADDIQNAEVRTAVIAHPRPRVAEPPAN